MPADLPVEGVQQEAPEGPQGCFIPGCVLGSHAAGLHRTWRGYEFEAPGLDHLRPAGGQQVADDTTPLERLAAAVVEYDRHDAWQVTGTKGQAVVDAARAALAAAEERPDADPWDGRCYHQVSDPLACQDEPCRSRRAGAGKRTPTQVDRLEARVATLQGDRDYWEAEANALRRAAGGLIPDRPPTADVTALARQVVTGFIAQQVGYEAPGMADQADELIEALEAAGLRLVQGDEQ